MAIAYIGYSFGFLAPGQTVGISLHGFSLNEVVAIDVHAYRSGARPGAFFPSVDLAVHNVGQHVDNTLLHTIWVTNVSTSDGAPPIPVIDVTILSQTLQ